MALASRDTGLASPDTLAKGFLALQVALGYEWLMSGLSKVATGGFPSKLGPVLTGMTQNLTGPFKVFIDDVAVPNGPLFGWLSMLGELSVGVVLIAASAVCLLAWQRLGSTGRAVLIGLLGLANLAGAGMSFTYHFVMGAFDPWSISPDPYDQGVDVASLLAILELIAAAVCFRYLLLLWRAARTVAIATEPG